MSDVEAVKEALAVWIPEYAEVLSQRDDMLMEPLEKVAAAASRWVRMVETGEVVESWIDEHGNLVPVVEPGRYLVVRVEGEKTTDE